MNPEKIKRKLTAILSADVKECNHFALDRRYLIASPKIPNTKGECMENLRAQKFQLLIAAACIVLFLLPMSAKAQLPVVKLIATGGTIAMKIDPVKKAPVPAITGEDLIATVPEIAQVAKMEVQNISNVPSGYMDPPRWIALTKEVTAALARSEVSGAIISHGTDTLEETAWWLDLTVKLGKTHCPDRRATKCIREGF